MNWLAISVDIIVGFVLGLACAFVLRIIQGKTSKSLAEELFRESEEQRKTNVEALIESMKSHFGALSLDALSKSTEELLKLSKSQLGAQTQAGVRELEGKKALIDQKLEAMKTELAKVSTLVANLERDRELKFGELTTQLKNAGEQTAKLMQTTNKLHEVLASSRARGQWGQRMAEDVLKLAGFIENINYLKQKRISGIGTQPDFTFLLPRDLKLNMDVKFPLDNYVNYLEAKSEGERVTYKTKFIQDIRNRMKEVTSREYINPEQNTVDYALLFIPNEQVYAFIHEQDRDILDEGLKNKVVFCSPITLFAVLAVIRAAVDNFALEQTSNEILSLLGAFKKQWGKFLEGLEKLGRRIKGAQTDYEELMTTRQRELGKPLAQIEHLRQQHGLPVTSDEQIGILPIEDKQIDDENEDTGNVSVDDIPF